MSNTSFLNQTGFTANTNLMKAELDQSRRGVFAELPKRNVGESKFTGDLDQAAEAKEL